MDRKMEYNSDKFADKSSKEFRTSDCKPNYENTSLILTSQSTDATKQGELASKNENPRAINSSNQNLRTFIETPNTTSKTVILNNRNTSEPNREDCEISEKPLSKSSFSVDQSNSEEEYYDFKNKSETPEKPRTPRRKLVKLIHQESLKQDSESLSKDSESLTFEGENWVSLNSPDKIRENDSENLDVLFTESDQFPRNSLPKETVSAHIIQEKLSEDLDLFANPEENESQSLSKIYKSPGKSYTLLPASSNAGKLSKPCSSFKNETNSEIIKPNRPLSVIISVDPEIVPSRLDAPVTLERAFSQYNKNKPSSSVKVSANKSRKPFGNNVFTTNSSEQKRITDSPESLSQIEKSGSTKSKLKASDIKRDLNNSDNSGNSSKPVNLKSEVSCKRPLNRSYTVSNTNPNLQPSNSSLCDRDRSNIITSYNIGSASPFTGKHNNRALFREHSPNISWKTRSRSVRQPRKSGYFGYRQAGINHYSSYYSPNTGLHVIEIVKIACTTQNIAGISLLLQFI